MIICPLCRRPQTNPDIQPGEWVTCEFCRGGFQAAAPETPPIDSHSAAGQASPTNAPATSAAFFAGYARMVKPVAPVVVRIWPVMLCFILAAVSMWFLWMVQTRALHISAAVEEFQAAHPYYRPSNEVLNAFAARIASERRVVQDGFAGLLVTSICLLSVYLPWVYWSYSNLPGLGGRQRRFSPAAAVGWHFCPIANLWKVPMILNDLWKGSEPGNRRRGTWMIPALVVLHILCWAILGLSSLAQNSGEMWYFVLAALAAGGLQQLLWCLVVALVTYRQAAKQASLARVATSANAAVNS